MTDAAPLLAAERRGFYAKHGLKVEISREVGWATIRKKIQLGELDAAQAPAPMLWAMQLGIGGPGCEVLTAFILSLNGNAVTLSRALGAGTRQPAAFREIVRARDRNRPLTFGIVFPFSSHHLLLRNWLRRCELDPARDVRIVVVPPGQMFRNLAAGTIEGYAVGEPWNTLAVHESIGCCPLWSAALGAPQVEKVLLVTRAFAASRAAEHAALIAALAESAAWCDEPANREPLADLLAAAAHLNLPAKLIAPALLGRFDAGYGVIESVPDFHLFHRGGANVPRPSKAEELQTALQSAGLLPTGNHSGLPQILFREDLHESGS